MFTMNSNITSICNTTIYTRSARSPTSGRHNVNGCVSSTHLFTLSLYIINIIIFTLFYFTFGATIQLFTLFIYKYTIIYIILFYIWSDNTIIINIQ